MCFTSSVHLVDCQLTQAISFANILQRPYLQGFSVGYKSLLSHCKVETSLCQQHIALAADWLSVHQTNCLESNNWNLPQQRV